MLAADLLLHRKQTIVMISLVFNFINTGVARARREKNRWWKLSLADARNRNFKHHNHKTKNQMEKKVQ